MRYADGDGDGFGAGEPALGCAAAGVVARAGDCDDADPSVFPSEGPESDRAGACLDALDSDCDHLVNDGCGPGTGEEVRVPAGPFTMGCSFTRSEAPCQRDELPVHRVQMSAYAIDRYEVTIGEYLEWLATLVLQLVDGQVMAEEQSLGVWALADGTPVTYWHYDEGGPGLPVLDDGVDPELPIATATFFGARAYCRWRGSDLPTEAMWEKAARGGLEQPDMGQRVYPWGDRTDVNVAAGDVSSQPSVVGTHPDDASPYGLLDMGGNVAEWTRDWASPSYYADSAGMEISDPFGPAAPNDGLYTNYISRTRTFRGGSWGSPVWAFSYVAGREFADASSPRVRLRDFLASRPGYWGVRCARYLPRVAEPPASCPDGAAPVRLYADADGDGFGAGEPRVACPTDGLVAEGGDCDDASAGAFPRGALETTLDGACANELDDDCNGLRNDGCGPGRGEEVLIPAGPVRLGCVEGDADCDADESPSRVVDLPAFVIDKYEVSLGQFETWFNTFFPKPEPGALVIEMQTLALYATTAGEPIARWDYMWLPGRGFQVVLRPGVDPSLPVGSVTEYGAAMYCREHGGALPTEAQWEKAARGGMEQPDHGARLYPMGDALPPSVLAHPTSSLPVGSTREDVSPYHVFDMAGNVTEWTRDFYWPDLSELPAGALWASQPHNRVYVNFTRSTRGGSYLGAATDMRISARRALLDDDSERLLRRSHQPTFGFRCVRPAGAP